MRKPKEQAQVDVLLAAGQVKVLPDSRNARARSKILISAVRRRYQNGETVNEIAGRLNIYPSLVRRWLGLPPIKPRKPERRRHRPKRRRCR